MQELKTFEQIEDEVYKEQVAIIAPTVLYKEVAKRQTENALRYAAEQQKEEYFQFESQHKAVQQSILNVIDLLK